MRFILLIPVFLLLLACDKEGRQAEKDDEIIVDYLSENNIEATKHSSGLYYTITEEGTGDHPTFSSTVEVRYKGYYTNGNIFDQNPDNETVSFGLENLIEGWQIGIPLLKEGGSGTFFVPSALAYGPQGSRNGIAPNTVLFFDIELVNIQ